jgi:hypothetical protein
LAIRCALPKVMTDVNFCRKEAILDLLDTVTAVSAAAVVLAALIYRL